MRAVTADLFELAHEHLPVLAGRQGGDQRAGDDVGEEGGSLVAHQLSIIPSVMAGGGDAHDGMDVRKWRNSGDQRDLPFEDRVLSGHEGEGSARRDPDQSHLPPLASDLVDILWATWVVSLTVRGVILSSVSPGRSGTTTRYPARAKPSARCCTAGSFLP